jgi:hypothetical protein
MRKPIGWLLLVLSCGLAPSRLGAQDSNYTYEVPPPPIPFTGPLSHPRYEAGGLYVGAEFLYLRETRPIGSQIVAVRGFMDIDGSVSAVLNPTTAHTRTFIGSGAEALNTNQVQGSGNFQPGTNVFLGWRFENGVTVDVNWLHLMSSRYSASASSIPPSFLVGGQLSDTFLFSPVVNFPPNFAGPPIKIPFGNPGALYGIWNGAETMQEQFRQRFDLGGLNVRTPIWQTDRYRGYAIFGPRLVSMWEEYWWNTIASPLQGTNPTGISSDATAQYHNIVSNRLYGGYLGCGGDWFLGSTPIGGFAATAQVDAALYMDFVKGRAGYDLGTRNYAIHRARNMSSLVPGVDAKVGLWWYPWEAVSIQLSYNLYTFFNTIASRNPIDFNAGTVDPQYDTGVFRMLHGVGFGIGFVF